jgi:hypothetical protein
MTGSITGACESITADPSLTPIDMYYYPDRSSTGYLTAYPGPIGSGVNGSSDFDVYYQQP